jgi:hypothetical protein
MSTGAITALSADDLTPEHAAMVLDNSAPTGDAATQQSGSTVPAEVTPVRLNRATFHEWLRSFDQASPPLLWSHVTNVWALLEILGKGSSTPFECPHFKKELSIQLQ